jgi:hypothetical protein
VKFEFISSQKTSIFSKSINLFIYFELDNKLYEEISNFLILLIIFFKYIKTFSFDKNFKLSKFRNNKSHFEIHKYSKKLINVLEMTSHSKPKFSKKSITLRQYFVISFSGFLKSHCCLFSSFQACR